MLTIWKYPLAVTDEQTLELPLGYKLLAVQAQGDVPCLWALVDPKQSLKSVVRLRTRGTGHPVPVDGVGQYLGTYQLDLGDGRFVGHVFLDN